MTKLGRHGLAPIGQDSSIQVNMTIKGGLKKKLIKYVCLLICIIAAQSIFAQCSPRKIAKQYKSNIAAPYKYDSYDYDNINFNDKGQTIEVVFTAFADVKYKLVFGTSVFDENIKVSIYDRTMGAPNRNKLYDGQKIGADNPCWSTEITNPGVYYIDYEIPTKGNSKSADGCVVMLIGFVERK